jgi:hypothetical protein
MEKDVIDKVEFEETQRELQAAIERAFVVGFNLGQQPSVDPNQIYYYWDTLRDAVISASDPVYH